MNRTLNCKMTSKMLREQTRPALLATATLVLSLVTAMNAQAQEPIDESRAVSPNERISIDVMRGDVRIRTTDEGVFRVRGTLDEEAEGYELESSGGFTRFEVEMPRSARGWSGNNPDNASDLDIELPAGSTLEFQGVSTTVIVSGITGGTQISSVNGRIEASSLSERVDLSTVNGSILSTGNSGRITLRSVNGEIEDSGSSGRIEYDSVNGDISAQSSASEVQIGTVNGDADVSLAGTADLSINTVNGDYTIRLTDSGSPRIEGSSVSGDLSLVLDPALNARVSMETHSGDIENGLSDASAEAERFGPRESLQFSLGGGSGTIELQSISGDLSLTLP